MKTSVTHAPAEGTMRTRRLSAMGFTLALACLIASSPRRAEDNRHGGDQQHNQGHSQPRQSYRHDDQSHCHDDGYQRNQGYGYEAPPVVYAPQTSPGISVFLPL
jgi:hypothetical protein